MSVILSLQTNLASLQAQRRLSEHTGVASQSMARLSSGLRITQAADDPAGAAVADDLRFQTVTSNESSRGLANTVGLFAVADSALEEMGNILTRLKELAEQGSSSGLGRSKHEALNAEAQALRDEYNRIVNYTEYNGIQLLDGSTTLIQNQAGLGEAGIIESPVASQLETDSETLQGDIQQTFNQSIGSSSLTDIISEDFDGDGLDDLLISDESNKVALFFRNNGSGYDAAVEYNTSGSYVGALVAGDIDGDGDLDFVAGESNGGIGGTNVVVYRNDGTGTFTATDSLISQYTSDNTGAIDLVDSDGDGDLDIVRTAPADGEIEVYLNNGNGYFNPTSLESATAAGIEVGYEALAHGQLANGNAFIAVSSPIGTEVQAADGSGNFNFYALIDYSSALAVGDINNDGIDDIIGGDVGQITLNLGTSLSSFSSTSSLSSDNSAITSIDLEDFNQDGNLDILVTGDAGAIEIFLGNGDGSFSAANSTTGYYIATASDSDGDGLPDVAAIDESQAAFSILTGVTTTATGYELPEFTIMTEVSARNALDNIIQPHFDAVLLERGQVGAQLSRLEIARNQQLSFALETSDARSKIRDVDVAEEAARLLHAQITTQGSLAVLTQANIQPQLALTLLGIS